MCGAVLLRGWKVLEVRIVIEGLVRTKYCQSVEDGVSV